LADYGNIVLIHLTTGERRVVPVELVTQTYVSVRWGMAGTYDLNLAANVLTGRGSQGQRKGKAAWYKKDKPQWKAKDIMAVRKMARDALAGEDVKELTRIAMEKHEAAMPGNSEIRKLTGEEFLIERASQEEIDAAPMAMKQYVMFSKRVVPRPMTPHEVEQWKRRNGK
jgi:hypothetical protein